jgi:hypothetical protein
MCKASMMRSRSSVAAAVRAGASDFDDRHGGSEAGLFGGGGGGGDLRHGTGWEFSGRPAGEVHAARNDAN